MGAEGTEVSIPNTVAVGPKPGYKSTEFWFSIATAITGGLLSSGIFPETSVTGGIRASALSPEARETQPQAGSLWHCRPGVKGRLPTPFAG